MNALPASSSFELISPLASKLVQFLAQKHAMGYHYRDEGRALRELDRFLNTRLSPEDPVITLAIVHDYVARRSTESETTRAHRLSLMREVCRFLRLEDARTVVPDRRSLRIVRQKFVPRVLSRDEGKRFLQACAELPQGRTSPVRDAVLGTALRLLYLAGLRAGELLRLTQADVNLDAGLLHIRHTKFDKSRMVPIAAGPGSAPGALPDAGKQALRRRCSREAVLSQPTRGTVFDYRLARSFSPDTEEPPALSARAATGTFVSMTCDIRLLFSGFCCGANRTSISAQSCRFWPHTLGTSAWPVPSATCN